MKEMDLVSTGPREGRWGADLLERDNAVEGSAAEHRDKVATNGDEDESYICSSMSIG